ncbi:hypothetical protein Tco_0449184, partial [Tanacetum coccineum]
LAPFDEEVPVEDQPYVVADSPIALSPGYVADSDPEEDYEDGSVDYPADGGDGDDDDEEKEEASEEEEDEHLAPADSVVAPEEVGSLLALPPPPPSPLILLSPPSIEEHLARCLDAPALPSSPLPIVPHPYGSPNHVRAPPGFRAAIGRLRALSPSTHHPLHPSPPLPPPPSSLHLPPHVPTSLTLPSSPLPASLFIPPPVGESLTAAPRPAGGHGIDYGFIGTLDAETSYQRAKEVGYGIIDTWVDPREASKEIAPVNLEGVNTRSVETLIDDRQYHYETARLLDQETLVSREAWAHSMGLTALTAQVSSLQGHLVTALGEIRELQARDQARADAPEGTGSSA